MSNADSKITLAMAHLAQAKLLLEQLQRQYDSILYVEYIVPRLDSAIRDLDRLLHALRASKYVAGTFTCDATGG